MYAGSFVYEDNDGDVIDDFGLDYILNPEDKIDKLTSSVEYHYHLKDHLGNTRVVFDGTGAVRQKTDYYPFGMTAYQSTSIDNKYLYNRKELQDEFLGSVNLDWYDYGARFYDPALGRWHVPDPAAENNHFEWSPYSYVYNNPIMLVDPFGLDSIFAKNFWGNVKNIGNDGKDDGKAYLVKGGTKRGVKNATKNGVDFSGHLSQSNEVVDIPTGGVMDDVISSVDATNMSQKENGGHAYEGDTKATRWDEGPAAVPYTDKEENPGARAAINMFKVNGQSQMPSEASNLEFCWHVHPNTTVNGVQLGNSNPTKPSDFIGQRTLEKIGFRGNAFVIGARVNKVTFYNSRNTIITIKYNDFKRLGGR